MLRSSWQRKELNEISSNNSRNGSITIHEILFVILSEQWEEKCAMHCDMDTWVQHFGVLHAQCNTIENAVTYTPVKIVPCFSLSLFFCVCDMTFGGLVLHCRPLHVYICTCDYHFNCNYCSWCSKTEIDNFRSWFRVELRRN